MFTNDQVIYMGAVYDALMSGFYTADRCAGIGTGISELDENEFTVIYTDDQLHISSDHFMNEIEIYDLTGKLVYSEKIDKSWEFHCRPNQKGTFVVRIKFVDSAEWKKQLVFVP